MTSVTSRPPNRTKIIYEIPYQNRGGYSKRFEYSKQSPKYEVISSRSFGNNNGSNKRKGGKYSSPACQEYQGNSSELFSRDPRHRRGFSLEPSCPCYKRYPFHGGMSDDPDPVRSSWIQRVEIEIIDCGTRWVNK